MVISGFTQIMFRFRHRLVVPLERSWGLIVMLLFLGMAHVRAVPGGSVPRSAVGDYLID